MAAEQQLERSVLERKEREELRAIADAMALDTNSRSKKADIIDQILRAAGVDATTAGSANGAGTTNGASAAPARPRACASSARAAATAEAEAKPDQAETVETAAGNGDTAESAPSNGTSPARSNGRSAASAPSSTEEETPAAPEP